MSNDGAERLLQQVQRRLPLGDDVRAIRLVIVVID